MHSGTVIHAEKETDDEHQHDHESDEADGLDPDRGGWAALSVLLRAFSGHLCSSRGCRRLEGYRYIMSLSNHHVVSLGGAYTRGMPRLWSATIETHRRAVRDAAVDVTAALVAAHGLRAVTMSEIAERTGIGRATLYKYFPDVESILREWHEREISQHLEQLVAARDDAAGAAERLEAVLETFATIANRSHGNHDAELAALLHRNAQQVVEAEGEVHRLVAALLKEGAEAGIVRSDVPPDELAAYCLHALAAAGTLRSRDAVRHLVSVTLAGLRPD
jgi:AcrR family transcriptional regulator